MSFLSEMVVFAKVVELRSFSEAARRLGVTSSAVSRSVGRLESHMGGRLLHRTTRSVAPTELGHQVFSRCALIAQTARDIRLMAGRYGSGPVGRLRVSAPVALGQHWLGPRLPAFLARWPDVEMNLSLNDGPPDLVDDGIDVALQTAEAPPAGLVARALARSSHVLVASPSYLQARGQPQSPAELAEHACVLPTPHEVDGELRLGDGRVEVGVQAKGQLTVDDGGAILGAVGAGLGIGLVPDYSAEPELQRGRLVRLLPNWSLLGPYVERKVYAIYAASRHLPHKVRVFVDHLAEH